MSDRHQGKKPHSGHNSSSHGHGRQSSSSNKCPAKMSNNLPCGKAKDRNQDKCDQCLEYERNNTTSTGEQQTSFKSPSSEWRPEAPSYCFESQLYTPQEPEDQILRSESPNFLIEECPETLFMGYSPTSLAAAPEDQSYIFNRYSNFSNNEQARSGNSSINIQENQAPSAEYSQYGSVNQMQEYSAGPSTFNRYSNFLNNEQARSGNSSINIQQNQAPPAEYSQYGSGSQMQECSAGPSTSDGANYTQQQDHYQQQASSTMASEPSNKPFYQPNPQLCIFYYPDRSVDGTFYEGRFCQNIKKQGQYCQLSEHCKLNNIRHKAFQRPNLGTQPCVQRVSVGGRRKRCKVLCQPGSDFCARESHCEKNRYLHVRD